MRWEALITPLTEEEALSRLRGAAEALGDWYKENARRLPWREREPAESYPYRVWVSEIMLQQTRVEAVLPYYERFLAEVLEPLRAGKDCSYRPYDCKQQKLAEPVAVRQRKLIVVEGSYSCHPTLWEQYDLHVFLTVNPQEQLRRIERRNGPQGLEMFRQRWIPLEERYFSACRVEERCELRLSSGE